MGSVDLQPQFEDIFNLSLSMFSIPGFFSSFEEYLESVITTRHNLIILGDFNFHMDIVDDSSAKRFRLLMDTFGLLNFVHFTTHVGGHTLDLVLTQVIDKIQP